MNILQNLISRHTFCVTLNRGAEIATRKIIKCLHYDHPLYTPDSVAAQPRQREINGINRTFSAAPTGAMAFTKTVCCPRSPRSNTLTRPCMHSAIYRGSLRHRRFAPKAHAFRYPLFMLYLDLAELDEVFRGHWLWSTRRDTLARFDRSDHLGDSNVSFDESVRALVAQHSGRRLQGPIRLLTHLCYFGYGFNPVSFYYCFDATDSHVECAVAEVNNTPWGEQHCYVLHQPLRVIPGVYQAYRSEKVLHVSPFMPMDLQYRWGLSTPGATLNVHMAL